MVPKSSAMYTANELAKRKLSEWNGGHTSALVAFTAGALSGYPEAITCVPHALARRSLRARSPCGSAARFQGDAVPGCEGEVTGSRASGSLQEQWALLSSGSCAWEPDRRARRATHAHNRPAIDRHCQVLKQEGLFAFTTGLGPTCWRNCVWNGVYFGLMHEVRVAACATWQRGPALTIRCCDARLLSQVKKALPDADTKGGDLAQSLAVGFVAGMIATGFNAPFDVVKSRFQSQLPAKLNNGVAPKYVTAVEQFAWPEL